MTALAKPFNSSGVLTAAGLWLLLALAFGLAGLPHYLTPPLPQVVLFGLTAVLLLLFWKLPGFQAWALSVNVRALILIHVTRFVGFYFLWLYGRGELPGEFALKAGWGDLAVAVTALLVVALVSQRGKTGWTWIAWWNAFGLADILMVVVTAARVGMRDPASMGAFLKLPLCLLLTFLVPIIIASHIVIFVRLWRSKGAGYPTV